MLFIFVDNYSLTLSFAIDPFALKYFSIWICEFAYTVLNVIFINSLKLGIVSPSVKSITMFFSVYKIAFKHLPVFVYYSALSIDLVIFEPTLIIIIRCCIFTDSMLNSINKMSLIYNCVVIFSPCLNTLAIR